MVLSSSRTFARALRLAALPFLFVLAFPQAAQGRRPSQAESPSGASEANELRGAEAALASHDLVAAEKELLGVYRRAPQPEVLYLLGVVARERGDLIATHDYFRRYLADPRVEANTAHAHEAEQFTSQRRGSAGELQVLGESGSLVFVDGHFAGALPLALPLLLPPGSHQVRLALSRKELSVKLEIADGRGTEVRFVPDYDALLVSVPPAVLVLPQWSGPPPPAERRLLQAAQQAIRGASHAVFDTDTALAHAPQFKNCLVQKTCRQQLAAKNGVDFVMTLSLAAPAAGSGAFTFAAELHSPRIELPAATGERGCPSCTLEQGAAQLTALIDEVVHKGGARLPGSLHISSVPAGAEVRLGSLVLGKTPAKLAVWAGEYDLSLTLLGHPPTSVHATVGEGLTELPPVILAGPETTSGAEAAATPLSKRRPRPRWRLIVGGLALGAGALMLANGISAAIIDGQCVDGMEGTPPACVGGRTYATQAPAIGLLSAGSIVAVAGIVLMAIPGPQTP